MIPRRKAHILKGEIRMALQMLIGKGALPDCINKWEEKFAGFVAVKSAIAVGSGRAGLELILKSLGLKEGDEVIIPAYTLKDLIGIIRSLGLTVIPADIDPETFNIDPGSILKKIGARTRVILATHIFGTPCRIDRILEIARSKSIFVIEDCAHSAGAKFNGQCTGSFGDAAFFSFETTKPINAYGGGMVVTNNEELFKRMRRQLASSKCRGNLPLKKVIVAAFENMFLPTALMFPVLSLLASEKWNKKISAFYRMIQKPPASNQGFSAFQTWAGLGKLGLLEERIVRRQQQANLFKSLLNNRIKPQLIETGFYPSYYFFVARLPSDAWQARKLLLRRGIDAGIGHEITDDCSGILGFTDCPNTRGVFKNALQLPLHEGLREKDFRYIAKTLDEVLL